MPLNSEGEEKKFEFLFDFIRISNLFDKTSSFLSSHSIFVRQLFRAALSSVSEAIVGAVRSCTSAVIFLYFGESFCLHQITILHANTIYRRHEHFFLGFFTIFVVYIKKTFSFERQHFPLCSFLVFVTTQDLL